MAVAIPGRTIGGAVASPETEVYLVTTVGKMVMKRQGWSRLNGGSCAVGFEPGIYQLALKCLRGSVISATNLTKTCKSRNPVNSTGSHSGALPRPTSVAMAFRSIGHHGLAQLGIVTQSAIGSNGQGNPWPLVTDADPLPPTLGNSRSTIHSTADRFLPPFPMW